MSLKLKDYLNSSKRFWKYVEKSSGCWEWTGCQFSAGYGALKVKGKLLYAHRVSVIIDSGNLVPEGLCVLHKCDVRKCVNPVHLFLGTRLDNSNDKVSKERQSRLPGERNGRAKLSEKEVIILRRLSQEGATVMDLVKEFSMSYTQVASIVNRDSWKHI